MIQFYFLSVLLNLVGGFALVIDSAPKKGQQIEGLKIFLRDPSVSLVLGILSAVVGAFKLLTVMRGDIPVVGDFLPAVAGLGVGLTLLLERYRDPERAMEGEASLAKPARAGVSKMELFLLDHRTAVGLAGMIAGLVHFLFPMVLFL